MQKKKILVTGGCGYIGSHTIVDLLENDFEVISIDNLSNGSLKMLDGIEKITGIKVKNYKIDLCNLEDTRKVFKENSDIVGIMHFAAFKSVPESVKYPLKYYINNINSLANVLICAQEFNVNHFIFSSSCSVYGNTTELPIIEETAFGVTESPYAYTKQVGEIMCRDLCKSNENFSTTILRYFNPVGAHDSVLIGELQENPENLVPVITRSGIGKIKEMKVYGNDYPTRDGSCIRDYIHVMDIASAHTKALLHSFSREDANRYEVFNLGSGAGTTVLEMIQAFEKVSGKKLNYTIVPRRTGDVVAVYADNDKARRVLGWEIKYNLEKMMDTAWRWEQTM
ncbi:MAG: UDP-glucose 4-epimerase GalE [Candidatus Nomurabacteria bacterium]|nr:UDP-glucose 4-epimerase GalE [Candidatus Nomurabacteria bacterium]